MERYIKYDFSDMERILFNFKDDQSASRLRQLKDELNKFFKDSTCKEVIYTKNIDKVFFGMCVMPVLSGDDAVEIIIGDTKKRITGYYLEIDSKLLELGLSARELLAVLLHEVGHMVLDSRPIEEVRNALNAYLSKNNEHLIITDSIHYRDLLAYAFKDSLRKVTTIINKKDEEIISDEFVVACGYGPELETAFRKLTTKPLSINKDVHNKLLVLQWTLRIYKDIKIRRIGALHSLNKGKNLTASTLEKREMIVISRALNQIDDDALIQESTNIMVRKANDSYKKFKYKGMRHLEEELFELALRVKNVDDEDDALILIRSVNTKISMIDDYIMSERLSDNERERWEALLHKYQVIRDEISKKDSIAKGHYYGLFVNTPTVRSRYDL